MGKKTKHDLILRYATNSRRCLKKAFDRRAPRVAENLTSLGKPIGERTVRRMADDADVTRRNILENTCLLLGACYLTDRKSFETVWGYLEQMALELRGKVAHYPSLDHAVLDLRSRFINAERVFFDRDEERMPEALERMDESLRGVAEHLFLKD